MHSTSSVAFLPLILLPGEEKRGDKVKETSQRAFARHQWAFALFYLLDLEQDKTVNAPTSGSKYLSPDLTTVVL